MRSALLTALLMLTACVEHDKPSKVCAPPPPVASSAQLPRTDEVRPSERGPYFVQDLYARAVKRATEEVTAATFRKVAADLERDLTAAIAAEREVQAPEPSAPAP